MSASRKGHFITAALPAFVLSLVVCPYAYIATGALNELKGVFIPGVLAPFIISSVFLLSRYLPRPPDPPKPRLQMKDILLIAVELVNWLVIVAFIYFILALGLPTGLERVGRFALLFLCTSALCLPVVLMRETTLERRLIRLPMNLSMAAFVIILSVSGAVIVADVLVSAKVGIDPRYRYPPE